MANTATAPRSTPAVVPAPPRKAPMAPTPTPANSSTVTPAAPAASSPTPVQPAKPAAPPRGTVAPAPAVPAKKASKLAQVITGVMDEAKRLFIYGTRGVGKTTLAADIPGAIFLDIDQGSGHLPISRYPLPDQPAYQDLLDAIDDLQTNEHAYGAVVIDEASKLESMIWRHIIENAPIDKQGDKPKSIEDIGGGFQKGYVVAEQEMRRLVSILDRLRVTRKMHIVILGHSKIVNQKNPGGDDYHRHVPAIDGRAAGVLSGGADVVAFATFDDVATKHGKKTIGSTGRRVLNLEHSASFDAKCRLPLPAMLDLDEVHPWAPFAKAIDRLRTMSPAALRAEIDAELARLGPTFQRDNGSTVTEATVRAAVADAGDHVGDLHRFLMTLKQATPVAQETTTP